MNNRLSEGRYGAIFTYIHESKGQTGRILHITNGHTHLDGQINLEDR